MASCNPSLARASGSRRRVGFTLLELILALALSVLVAGLLASLVGMYSSAFATRGEDIRRVALARSVLGMIAEDLRSTVTDQKFDASVLQQMLTGQAAGGGSAAAVASESGPAGPTGPAQSGPAIGPGAGPASQDGRQSAAGSAAGSEAIAGRAPAAGGAKATAASPLGLYGSATNLTVDISRLPRPDEYVAQQTAMLTGTLNDVPGDIKRVSYWIQLPTTMGVVDNLTRVSSLAGQTGSSRGLVRRVLDRAVLAHAEELGQSDQLNRTGDLIAPEVLSLEFMYYDGKQWLPTWDSAKQGLPWLIEISLAMQSKSGEKRGVVMPGISLASMPSDRRALYGIEVYTLTVAIPGAQLQANVTESTGTGTRGDSGMSSVGL